MRGKQHQSSKANASGSSGGGSTQNTILDGLSLMQRGNEYFFSDCYLEATGYYYQAAMLLKVSPEHKTERSKAWSNVAECHLRLQNWQAAEDAATNAIAVDHSNIKALYRRAKARFELRDYSGAAKDADAVGTPDAMDVSALCHELAHADVALKLTVGVDNNTNHAMNRETRRERRERRQPSANRGPSPSPQFQHAEAKVRDPAPPLRPSESAEERELWFRRIVDSYRLRVDDEYTQTGASDAGSLYGIQAKGLGNVKSPMGHFQSYVNRATKKRVLPTWFTVGDMEELCHLASHDPFSNIHLTVTPNDIVRYYSARLNPVHNELQELRDLAVYIEGPIGMPWKSELRKPVTPEKKKTPLQPNIVLEPGTNTRPNRYAPESSSKAVYELSEKKYAAGRPQTGAYHGRRIAVEPTAPAGAHKSSQRRDGGIKPSQHIVPYPSADSGKRENRPPSYPHHHQQKAPGSPKQRRPPPARAPTPVTEKRNPMYPYNSDTMRRGQRAYDHQQQQQQQQQQLHANAVYTPQSKKREQLGLTKGTYKQPHRHQPQPQPHSNTNRYGFMCSEERQLPSPCPIADSDSTESFGPQLPYNPVFSHPGLPNTHSARKMMMSLMPSMHSDEEESDNSYETSDQFGKFYSQEDNITEQEVRHGLWRGDLRDECSELTELSP